MQIRCPHCHNPVEVVNGDPSGDVSCPACGSCFNLAKDLDTVADDGTLGMIGHYQLLKSLGRGAFSEVLKARDTKLENYSEGKAHRSRRRVQLSKPPAAIRR